MNIHNGKNTQQCFEPQRTATHSHAQQRIAQQSAAYVWTGLKCDQFQCNVYCSLVIRVSTVLVLCTAIDPNADLQICDCGHDCCLFKGRIVAFSSDNEYHYGTLFVVWLKSPAIPVICSKAKVHSAVY